MTSLQVPDDMTIDASVQCLTGRHVTVCLSLQSEEESAVRAQGQSQGELSLSAALSTANTTLPRVV